MARHRSKNPQRIKSEKLRDLLRLLPDLSDEELLLARNLPVHEQARRNGFADSRARRIDEGRLEALIALDEADIRCREAENGRPLRIADDYRTYKRDEDIALTTIIKRLGGTWGQAQAEAGLLERAQPEAELTLEPGSPAKSRGWSPDDCVACYALVAERFRGRLFSEAAYNHASEAMGVAMPTYDMVRRAVTGATGKSQGALDRVRAAAKKLILANPSTYPAAFDYLTRVAKARG